MKGSRVASGSSKELQGEKIDIIPWSQGTLRTFVVNALQPATVSQEVVIDEEESRDRSRRSR